MTKEFSLEREPLGAEHYRHLVHSPEAKRLVERFFELGEMLSRDPRREMNRDSWVQLMWNDIERLRELGEEKIAYELSQMDMAKKILE